MDCIKINRTELTYVRYEFLYERFGENIDLYVGGIAFVGVRSILSDQTSESEKEIIGNKIEDESEWESHLCSAHTFCGFLVQSSDDNIGRVGETIIDVESWKIMMVILLAFFTVRN